MSDDSTAVLKSRDRKTVLCNHITDGGKPCGERLGRIVFSRAAEKRYFSLLENPTFDSLADDEALEDALEDARFEMVTTAYFEPRGTDEMGNTGWIRRSDEHGEYIEYGSFAKKQLDDQKGELRPRQPLDEASYEVFSGEKPFVTAARRYQDPIRVRCRRCLGFSGVDPARLIEESTRRREMRSINFQ